VHLTAAKDKRERCCRVLGAPCYCSNEHRKYEGEDAHPRSPCLVSSEGNMTHGHYWCIAGRAGVNWGGKTSVERRCRTGRVPSPPTKPSQQPPKMLLVHAFRWHMSGGRGRGLNVAQVLATQNLLPTHLCWLRACPRACAVPSHPPQANPRGDRSCAHRTHAEPSMDQRGAQGGGGEEPGSKTQSRGQVKTTCC
jgi:hypothetical protein